MGLFNISHIFSTRYKASSNGSVERCNRTIIELLKGFPGAEARQDWDQNLGRVVVIYNNTWHTELGMSPNSYLFERSHEKKDNFMMNSDTVKV